MIEFTMNTTRTGYTGAWRRVFDLSPRRFDQGAIVFPENASLHDIFLVERGVVKVVYDFSKDGNVAIVPIFRRPGQLIVPDCLISGACLTSVVAVTETLLFRVQLDERGGLGSAAQQLLIDQIRLEIGNSVSELAEVHVASARVRLELLLRRIADLMEGEPSVARERSFRVPLKSLEMAGLIGVSPEHLSRLKKQLRAEGRLSWVGERWTVRTLRDSATEPAARRNSRAAVGMGGETAFPSGT